MKTSASTTILSILFVFAFSVSNVFAQYSEKRDVSDFTKITIGKGVKVVLSQSTIEGIEIEGDKDYVKKVSATVKDGELIIEGNAIPVDKSPVVNLSFKNITALTINADCGIKADDDMTFESLALVVKGKCTVNFKMDVRTLLSCKVDEASVNIIGTAGVFNGSVGNLGNIGLDLDADKIRIQVEEGTTAKLSGSTGLLFANISGNGKLHAFDLHGDKVRVSIFGESLAEVHVLRELHVIADGSCKVYYKGDPRSIKSEKSGGAEVIEVKE